MKNPAVRLSAVFPLLALSLALTLAGCTGLRPVAVAPRVNLVDLRVVDVGLFEQRYALTLRLQNPNPEDLSVVGLDFRLSLNGEAFADGVSNQSVSIPAYGEALLDLEVSSSLWRIIEQVRALDSRGRDGLHYRIHGTLALAEGWSRVPFDREGAIRLDPAVPANRL